MKAEDIKKAKEYLNNLYGIGNADHKTGLETGHYLGAISDLIKQNKELILCLENSTKIMEDQEGEVMDLVICDTMNHQIRWNRETIKINKK